MAIIGGGGSFISVGTGPLSSSSPVSQAATPTFSPAAGTYSSAQSVTISCATSAPTIYYTTDGSTPTTSSAVYSSAITVSSSETIKAIATATGYTQSAVGSAAYVISSSSELPMGMNLFPVSYYSTEFPYLNLMKAAGSAVAAANTTGWWTSTSSSIGFSSTGEEALLPLDSDGYPTTVNGSSVGASFTSVWTCINVNIGNQSTNQSSVAGLTYPYGYAGISYTVQWSGTGTVEILGDASATLTASGQTFTVATPGYTGIRFAMTSTGGTGSHMTNISVVETSLVSQFNAGAIFHPNYIASLANLSCFRFMERMRTNILSSFPSEMQAFSTASGTINAGATNLTMSENWPNATSTRTIYFIDGTQRTAVFTANSTYVDWSADSRGGIPNALTQTYCGQNFYCNFSVSYHDTWSQRSLPSNCFWSLAAGEPLEISIALCNQLNAHAWLNMPLSAPYSYMTSFAQALYNGTGLQSGFSPLNSGLRAYMEFSNEIWNFGTGNYARAGSFGAAIWPSHYNDNLYTGNTGWCQNFFGMQTAQMANIFSTVLGSNFSSRCTIVLGAKGADVSWAQNELATAYWTSAVNGLTGPASNYQITGCAIAPYWMLQYPTQSSVTTMTNQSDGGLTYLFELMTTNVMSDGTSFASDPACPSNGWIGTAESWATNHLTEVLNSYPSIKLLAYEGTQNLAPGLSATPSGWDTLQEAAQIDSRMGTQYKNYFHWWYTNVGNTTANMNCVFTSCTPRGNKSWGIIEDTRQTFSAQPKWAALQSLMGGG